MTGGATISTYLIMKPVYPLRRTLLLILNNMHRIRLPLTIPPVDRQMELNLCYHITPTIKNRPTNIPRLIDACIIQSIQKTITPMNIARKNRTSIRI
jgi:hypothetical protein